jgi:3'-5' exoribonuclease
VAETLDPMDFLARGLIPPEESIAGVRGIVGTMQDRHLRGLVLVFLDDPAFARAFAESPAAKLNHHAYVGGLAEHTLSVMRLCDLASGHYPDLDRDLLLTGAFFHDVGKTRELAVEPGFPYTEEGTLLGHIALGFAMVRERIDALPGFPAERRTDLGHLILSHQGELEWGSPVIPQTMEAIVLHFLDNLDSKVTIARAHTAGVEGGRTPYIRSLGRALFRRGTPPSATQPEVAGNPDGPGERPPTLFDDLGPERRF